MPYLAARKMTVMGEVYEPGQEIPLSAIPPRSIATLVSLRRIIETDRPSVTASVEPPKRKRGRPRKNPLLGAVEG